jgi:hypothetical protein
MLIIRKIITVEYVKRNECESISHYSHTHKHKESSLHFKVNVIKREATFLLKETYFLCSHSLEENS